jgi:predicted permease
VLARIDNVGLDWRVLLFAVSAVCVTGAAGGVAHYLATHRSLRAGSGNRVSGSNTSTVLVVAQVALALMLLVGAGLLVKGFNRVLPKSPGFVTANRAVLELSLVDDPSLAKNRGATGRAILDILARMKAMTEVEDAAMVSFVPLRGMVSIAEVDLPEAPVTRASRPAFSNVISPNYFRVMGIPLKAGRPFTASDVDGSTLVAIVNDSAAARWWPGLDPIGRQVITGKGARRKTSTIVGVVGGSRMTGRNLRRPPELFWPLAQSDPKWATFVVATRQSPAKAIPALRRTIHDVAPRAPISHASDYESIAMESVRMPRFYSAAMSMFAGAAVLLSAMGVYGLLAFAVAQRRREIGIRMALGASARRIGARVVGRAMAIGGAGVAVGLLAAFGLSRYMASLLVEVTPTDRTVFLACGIIGFVIAVVAASVPAYSATHTDPMRSLRA